MVRFTPARAEVSSGPLIEVTPVPADCVRLAALNAPARLTSLALAMVTAPRRLTPPTMPPKLTGPAPATSDSVCAPSSRPWKLMLPVPVPVLMMVTPSSVLSPKVAPAFSVAIVPPRFSGPAVAVTPPWKVSVPPFSVVMPVLLNTVAPPMVAVPSRSMLKLAAAVTRLLADSDDSNAALTPLPADTVMMPRLPAAPVTRMMPAEPLEVRPRLLEPPAMVPRVRGPLAVTTRALPTRVTADRFRLVVPTVETEPIRLVVPSVFTSPPAKPVLSVAWSLMASVPPVAVKLPAPPMVLTAPAKASV